MNSIREKLEAQVEEAKKIYALERAVHSKRDNVAMQDMIHKAEDALEGRKFPFSCSRGFWERRDMDELFFALHRFTMVPTYLEPGKVYGTYGLEDAVKWYQENRDTQGESANHVRLKVKKYHSNTKHVFLSASELAEIRRKIKAEDVFQEQYQKMKAIAEEATLEERERGDQDCGMYNLSMQCDGMMYLLTGDRSYARKAKVEMLQFLDDFCQGAYYWMTYNERPEGIDAYGAVQAGRNLCSIAAALDCIRGAGVFSKEERERFYDLVDFILHYVLDLRDRTAMSFQEVQAGSSNWQTDMCIGAFMILCVLEDFPNREQWMDNAYALLYGQMIENLNQDNSWPESIRYHHAALERFMTFARLLKRVAELDWFADTNLIKMFDYGVDMQTPPYPYFDNCISTPTFGDHKLSGGEDFVLYGLYVEEVAQVDPQLADRMYLTWCRGGRKIKAFWGESLVLENFLYPSDYQPIEITDLNLVSTAKYPDAGIYVFRNSLPSGKMDYLAVMSSKKRVGHGHLDQGSFILYKENIPVIMDSGMEGYFDSTTPWHISSYSHACMLFATEKVPKESNPGFINLSVGNFTRELGYLDTPDKSRVISCEMGGTMESIQMEIRQKDGAGRQIRTIQMDWKNRAITVEDKVEHYEGEILSVFPLMAKKVTIQENKVLVEGYYGVTLSIQIETPFSDMEQEKGRTARVHPGEEAVQYLEYLRIHGNAKDGIRIKIS